MGAGVGVGVGLGVLLTAAAVGFYLHRHRTQGRLLDFLDVEGPDTSARTMKPGMRSEQPGGKLAEELPRDRKDAGVVAPETQLANVDQPSLLRTKI